MHYQTNGSKAATPRPLVIGEEIKLDDDPNPWTVKAITDHFAALTRPVTQQDRNEAQAEVEEHEDDSPYRELAEHRRSQLDETPVFYTVLDWRNGIRGACNLIGQSYGDGTYDKEECAAMLADFEAGDLEISHRNWVRLRFATGVPVRP